ncbi:MAG: magnesium/cobalt transporter CorA [Pirellulaceae bacterium]|nr:magnesium/cobalt transporter CorA [Pirellulaceae bacterium]
MVIKPTRRHRNSHNQRRRVKPGTPPGTIAPDPNAQATKIRVMAYSPAAIHETDIQNVDQLKPLLQHWPVTWIDVTGLGTAQTIQELGQLFQLHPLAMEDVVNVHQRAKLETYTDHLFIVSRMCNPEDDVRTEQISLFLRQGVLLTFQERPGDCWNPVRERLRQARGRIRNSSVDYLAYTLMDAIVDSYFPMVDSLSDRLDQLDDEVTARADNSQMHRVHDLRGQLLALRRAIRPHREMINELTREDVALISPETRVFFRDCYDHVIQVIDLVDTYRELTADVRDFYMSSVSNRMNEIMKVLTIIATIFMPLSFIAGVYGMNFNPNIPWNMPELNLPFGYPLALLAMVATALAFLWYFKRKGWIFTN